MKKILYSKDLAARCRFVETRARRFRRVVYLAPKKFIASIQAVLDLPDAVFIAYEDVIKSNEAFALASNDTLLVYDRPARYKNITSGVFVRLSRIGAQYKNKCMVDIVPFTEDIKYLYCPLAFIDRGILQYQHWYAYRENNYEMVGDKQVLAHDYDLLAHKMAPYCDMDYAQFTGNDMTVMRPTATKEELADYASLREELFQTKNSGGPIVTALADRTNIFETRYAMLGELLARLPGKTVIYTNLSGHNRRLKKRFSGVEIKSFYDANGAESEFDHVILFEVPIVKGYLFLDILANVRSDCQLYVFNANTPVDKYLFKKMSTEFQQLNAFTRTLSEHIRKGG